MSKRIWKYPIEPGYLELRLPVDSQILSVQVQSEQPFLWVLVNPEDRTVSRRFKAYPTGLPIEDESINYIGTFQLDGGKLVFHLFEIINP